MHMSLPFEAYKSGEYLAKNPTWDIEDSAWKAAQVRNILVQNRIFPNSVVEVGCGAGGILATLHDESPDGQYVGFEIAPDASLFWDKYKEKKISFVIGDFLSVETPHFEVLLLLDVVEHIPDPFAFLNALRGRANYFVFHIPLDLSAVSVLREQPLLNVREKVGHIHYFTKGLALSLIQESGFEILDWNYTGAAFSAPQRTWKSRLALLPRRLANAVIGRDAGVRLLGGDTLMVLAQVRLD
jgi:SAM-dependent methyltransferase